MILKSSPVSVFLSVREKKIEKTLPVFLKNLFYLLYSLCGFRPHLTHAVGISSEVTWERKCFAIINAFNSVSLLRLRRSLRNWQTRPKQGQQLSWLGVLCFPAFGCRLLSGFGFICLLMHSKLQSFSAAVLGTCYFCKSAFISPFGNSKNTELGLFGHLSEV